MSESGYKMINGDYYVKVGMSKNDMLSLNIPATIDMWLEQGYEMINADEVIEKVDPTKRLKCRYIGKDGKARSGGIVKKVVDEIDPVSELPAKYVLVENPYIHKAWSVQIDTLEKFFFMPIKKKEKRAYDDPEIMKKLEEIVKVDPQLSLSVKKLHDYCKENDMKIPRLSCEAYIKSIRIMRG